MSDPRCSESRFAMARPDGRLDRGLCRVTGGVASKADLAELRTEMSAMEIRLT